MTEKFRILVIDDERINRTIITDILSPDYDIYLAKDGAQGIKIAQKVMPDLILLDVLMPGQSGLEIIVDLKSNENFTNIPVIFLTSLTSETDEQKGFEVGAVDYIIKPVKAAILKARVSTHIKLRHYQQELTRLLNLDALTQIANRRNFDDHIYKELNKTKRNGSCLALAICDIDYFKKYNDTYGHLKGDKALIQVAQSINSSLNRASDFVARYGGEEFAIVISNADKENIELALEKCRVNVEALALEHRASEVSKHVTLSIGYCIIPTGTKITVEEMISKADSSLYKAKESGRNQVISAEKYD